MDLKVYKIELTNEIRARSLLKDLENLKLKDLIELKENENKSKEAIHLEAIGKILKNNKFVEIDVKDSEVRKKMRNEIKTNNITKYSNKNGLHYFQQLYGTQQFPDFTAIKLVDYKIKAHLNIEAKTTKDPHNAIFWNDGRPREDSLYIFTNYEKDITYVIPGKYLLVDSIFKDYYNELKRLQDEINVKCKELFDKYTKKNNSTTVKKMKKECKSLGIRGYSKLKKAELIELLAKHKENNNIKDPQPLPNIEECKVMPRKCEGIGCIKFNIRKNISQKNIEPSPETILNMRLDALKMLRKLI